MSTTGTAVRVSKGDAPWQLIACILALASTAGGLTWRSLEAILPHAQWGAVLAASSAETAGQILFLHAALPRIAMALLCGAALALSGTLFQQVLRNPLAEPTTLGVSAGAQTGLLIALLWAPGLMHFGLAVPALLGGLGATLGVFAIARGGTASPLTLIMAGLIVNLTLGTLCAVIVLFYPEQAENLSQWQTGRLEQNGWAQVEALAPWLLVAIASTFFFSRPLSLLDVGDDRARALGLNLSLVRPAALLVAIMLAGLVVSFVGIIGFVGLAVPAIARLLGARRLVARLVWSPVLGGLFLWLTDQTVQHLPLAAGQLPTGIFTALLGAPVLLALLPRLWAARQQPAQAAQAGRRLRHPVFLLLVGALVLGLLVAVSLGLGQSENGWTWSGIGEMDLILRWRVPRVVAALCAGVLLGLAGTLMQRMTGNPMASPEVLGVSSGATLGAILLVHAVSDYSPASLIAAGTAGAAGAMLLVLALGWRSGFSADRMILGGVALGTTAGAIAALMIARGGPERGLLLTWMSGSTYKVTIAEARIVAMIAAAALIVCPLFGRWLQILPLGSVHARAVGLRVGFARGTLVAATAIMTASATLIVGPSSFIGLLAPHMVRMIGFQRPGPQLLASALAGGLIMVAADWLGRMLLFPWQISAGLLATLVGAPYFLVLMGKRR